MLFTFVGDMVLIPANVPLYQSADKRFFKDGSSMTPTHMINTKKPEYAIVLKTGASKAITQIFWNGDYWWVNNDDIYEGNI